MKIETCNSLTLAYLGDAVYELFIRRKIIEEGLSPKVDVLHKEGISFVNAKAQAYSIKAMIKEGFLTEEELMLTKRARNHKTASKAKNANILDYKWATALEALIGWLSLTNQDQRLLEIMEKAVSLTETKNKNKE